MKGCCVGLILIIVLLAWFAFGPNDFGEINLSMLGELGAGIGGILAVVGGVLIVCNGIYYYIKEQNGPPPSIWALLIVIILLGGMRGRVGFVGSLAGAIGVLLSIFLSQ